MIPLIFFDIETGGIDMDTHAITQIAAVEFDASGQAKNTFEGKIRFAPSEVTEEALELSSYNEGVWEREARPRAEVMGRFVAWLKAGGRRAIVRHGRRGPYKVAQLAGHNVNRFDIPFLFNFNKRIGGGFLPIEMIGIDTYTMSALLRAQGLLPNDGSSLRLGDLCAAYGVELDDAHDALSDAEANGRLFYRMMGIL